MFPASLTKLTLIRLFKHITPGMIPSSVTHLSFLYEDSGGSGVGQTSTFEPGSLPPGLHFLDLFYSQPFQSDVLPGSLKHLRIQLPTHNREMLPLAEEDSLVPSWFLPPSLKRLTMSHYQTFTPPMLRPGVIPQSVTSLDCRMSLCDQQSMPSTLRHLSYLLELSDTNVQLSLMTSLQSLILSNLTPEFTIPFRSLPPSLTSLKLRFSPYLRVWDMTTGLADRILCNLPHSITDLEMNPPSFVYVPKSVTSLALCTHAPIQPGALPSSLTSLVLFKADAKYTLSPDQLPASLTELAVHDAAILQLHTPYSTLIRNVRIMNGPPTFPRQLAQVFAVGTNIEYHYKQQDTRVSQFWRIIDQSYVSPQIVGGFLNTSVEPDSTTPKDH
ncbi:hypothetical protein SAMD00019534_102550 [Acytostelium subglobosum LB1]|uniref:hypothetical protein n=1 Tax=Acytostelium subglobosum LB1 TaxID=1410327 RepID=UPI0006448315|nr:hypothetical protein SAMD00019534_102550 [Acytostelium subglobosum LB1]GAM27080.1 hypothetical protein SAMD00019534_102550 [Acytostelium subglobosum LB1]|eukprot:XP_012749960.1 hypothetical protein SAMD00019534_102550 [Acytostelium subglobosum LB1]